MQHVKKAIHAFRSAYHRRRIVRMQRNMERQYLRGAPLTADQMLRWSVVISQHCISSD